MVVIRKCRSALRLLKREAGWLKDRYGYRNVLQPKTVLQKLSGNILILMPHSDDEWIGCSSVLTNHKNILVLNMDMNGGDTEQMHELRSKEALKAAKKYGYHLHNVGTDKIEELGKVLKEYVPEYVLLPCYLDWHEEHIEVMNLFLESVKQSELNVEPKIAMYQVSLPLPYHMINCCYPMSRKQWKRKWREFCRIYKSQTFLPVRRFAYNEYINGAVCNAYACEAFILKPFEMWEEEFQDNKLTEKEKCFCREHVQEIGTIRRWINKKTT